MKRLFSVALALLCLLGTVAGPGRSETVYWINPDGGSRYHLDRNCPSINPRYLPLTVSLTEEELKQPPNDGYRPCSVCVGEEEGFFPEEERETGEPAEEPERKIIVDPQFSEYALTDYYADETPVLTGGQDMLVKARSTAEGFSREPRYLLWYRDGKLYREIACKYGTAAYWLQEGVFLSRRDDGCGLAAISAAGLDFCRWEEEGMIPEKSIAGNWTGVYGIPEGVCGVRTGADNSSAHLFDPEGNEIWSYVFPDNRRTWYAKPVAADGNGTYLVNSEVGDGLYTMFCIRDGKEAWHQNLRYQGTGFMTEDQAIFLAETTSGDDQYADLTLERRAPDGKSLGMKRLCGDRVVKSIRSVLYNPETGGYTIYGTAVANSRSVYTVFRMELDRDLNQQELTVKDFSFHNDYAFGVVTRNREEAYAFSRPYDESYVQPVLVPFDALPAADDHGLRIR